MLQFQLAAISRKIQQTHPTNNLYKLIYEDIVNIFVILALVLLWRGGWQLNEMYILEDKRIGGPVTHVVGRYHTDITPPYPAYPMSFQSALASPLLVLLWRGGWQLNEKYILENRRIGGPVTHVALCPDSCHILYLI